MKIDATLSSQAPAGLQVADPSATPVNTDSIPSLPVKDLLSLTDEARRRSKEGVQTHHTESHGHDGFPEIFADFLKDILKTLTGRDVESLESSDDAEAGELQVVPSAESLPQTVSAGYQQVSLSYQQFDLSMSGAINTADGKQIAFTLDLQYDSVQLSSQSAELVSGPEGMMFNFSGTAAEISSTSFSFTLASSDLQGPATAGHGRLNLNHEISAVLKEAKPLIKEFLSESGAPAGFSDLNRAVRSIA